MASTTGGLKADGPQFVQRNDKLQDGSSKTGTKSDEQTIATSLLPEGTKAVEPNNATSPHEVAVPSLDRLDLNENSDGAIEDLSEGKLYIFLFARNIICGFPWILCVEENECSFVFGLVFGQDTV
ncbi:hypothetical protein ABKV19_023723 [Rosa sericea]